MRITDQLSTASGKPLSNRSPSSAQRALYLRTLAWAFTLFSSGRMLAYVPTMWAIYSHGDASQHSLLTWLTWLGANTTMAAWIYEQNGQRFSSVVGINISNAVMCLATATLIAVFS